MSKLSFLDKLKVFFEVSKNSYWFPIIMILLLGVAVLFLSNKKKTIKQEKTISIIFSILIILLVFIVYHTSIINIFDYMMDNLFITIYFPTITIYFAAMIITNVIFWISLINQKTSRIIKKVNIVVYVLMNYLLALILNIVNTEELDVFTQSSIYGNTKVTALIELSSIIFIVWIIFLILYRIILAYIRKDYKETERRSILKRIEKRLPDNYKPIQLPNYIKKFGKNQKEENKTLQPIPEIVELQLQTPEKTTIEVDTLEEIKRKKEETERLTKEYEKMLTADDYRLLLKLLQEQKERGIKKQKEKQQQEEPKLIPIEEYRQEKQKEVKQIEDSANEERLKEIRRQKEILERQKEEALRLERLRIEELKRQELEREQNNFTELEALYRGISR